MSGIHSVVSEVWDRIVSAQQIKKLIYLNILNMVFYCNKRLKYHSTKVKSFK